MKTVVSRGTLVKLMLAIGIWVIIEICTVKKDGQDLPFK